MRLTLQSVSDSRIPAVLGICAGDYPRLSSFVNQATEELMLVASETGWADGWDKVVLNVPCDHPYLTLPPQYSRLISINVCRVALPVLNSWYEVLEAGIGIQYPCPITPRYGCGMQAAFERTNVPTAVDLSSTNQFLRVYITDARDINKNILFLDAKDANGTGIYSTNVGNQINGFQLTLNQPFVTSDFIVSSFSAIVKDVTFGDVILMQVDQTTGAEIQLARYTPQQTNPVFRRYYLQAGCWPKPDTSDPLPMRVTAMAKLEYRPVSQPTDLLLISNLAALKAKCESIRYAEMDNPTALQMSAAKHAGAIRLLNHELATYHGDKPAVNFAPFGTAKLEHQMIGRML